MRGSCDRVSDRGSMSLAPVHERSKLERAGGLRKRVRQVDKRYCTILNDPSVPAYTVADAGIGYRIRNVGRATELTVQLNVTNLFDEELPRPHGYRRLHGDG